ncbi:MAG: hypothetical protein HY363_00070 [Candidatus Aenigmarchaeota archaeon]|nr:hypothetical protein [Candidatus Aenigmarchaeota archaeon]
MKSYKNILAALSSLALAAGCAHTIRMNFDDPHRATYCVDDGVAQVTTNTIFRVRDNYFSIDNTLVVKLGVEEHDFVLEGELEHSITRTQDGVDVSSFPRYVPIPNVPAVARTYQSYFLEQKRPEDIDY